MGKISFEILEDQFLVNSTPLYNLSILVGIDRFSYLISSNQHQVLVLKTYTYLKQTEDDIANIKSELHDIFLEDKLLQLTYQKTRIACWHAKNTYVPNRLFQEENKASYLEKMFAYNDKDEVLYDELISLHALNVYVLNNNILSILKNSFPTAKIFHSSTALLLGQNKASEQLVDEHVYVNISKEHLQLSYFKGKDFLFNNNFHFRTAKDFIYYILLIYEQFKLKPEIVPLTISGQLTEDSQIYRIIYRYIRNIHFCQAPGFLRFGSAFDSHSKHFFFDLFSVGLCE